MAGTYDASKGNPNRIGTFSLVRNTSKLEEKHPDLVHPDSVDDNGNPKLNKAGKPFKKNFTITMNGVEVWCEASAYIQKDKSLKISINKTSRNAKGRAAFKKNEFLMLINSLNAA